MVIALKKSARRGWLMIELAVAIALLTTALLPLAYSFWSEKRFMRVAYQYAIATEIVDGETEVLAAGAWKTFTQGNHAYNVHCAALTNLPPGRFLLTVKPGGFRLQWQPPAGTRSRSVYREVDFK